MPDKDAIRVKQWQDEIINRVAVKLAERQAKLTWLPEIPSDEEDEEAGEPGPGDSGFVRKPARSGFSAKQPASSNDANPPHGRIHFTDKDVSGSGTSLAQLGEQLLGKKGMRQLENKKRQGGIRDGEANRARRPAPPPESDSEEEGGRAAAFSSRKRKPKGRANEVRQPTEPQNCVSANDSANGDGRTRHEGDTTPGSPPNGAPSPLPGPDAMEVETETPLVAQTTHGMGPTADPNAKTFLDEVIAERSKKKRRKKKKSKAEMEE
ncbi:MAG: hypothetical protein M1831_007394 [Alyxoria varia]|nr:MAG: hypothetical protein M1831_007394 [Alyxoria varia]